MIRFRPKASEDRTLDLTPVIDVVFLLLIFFVLAASVTVRGVDMELPEAERTSAAAGDIVEIRLTEDGRFFVDDVPVETDDLEFALARAESTLKERRFVLFAHPKAPAGELVRLVDLVRKRGGDKLMVATETKREAS